MFHFQPFFLNFAEMWRDEDILIIVLVRFLCKSKLFVLLLIILYINFFKYRFCRFFTSSSKVVIHIYSAFKIENIVNHKNVIIFSFLWFSCIRGICSKYFQNGVSEVAISCVTLKQTTWCSFLIILYIFSRSDKSLF